MLFLYQRYLDDSCILNFSKAGGYVRVMAPLPSRLKYVVLHVGDFRDAFLVVDTSSLKMSLMFIFLGVFGVMIRPVICGSFVCWLEFSHTITHERIRRLTILVTFLVRR